MIRGATLIDGTGAKPRGRSTSSLKATGSPTQRGRGSRPGPPRPPFDADHEVDATGMYVLPGFIDAHVHAGGPPKNSEAEYPYKLWLAHGVTTVRGVPLADFDFTVIARSSAAPATRSWRRGSSTTHDRPKAGIRVRSATTPPRRARGSAGRPSTASTASSSATPSAATRRSPPRSWTRRTSAAWAPPRTWRRSA